jgi:hypothetical protein
MTNPSLSGRGSTLKTAAVAAPVAAPKLRLNRVTED